LVAGLAAQRVIALVLRRAVLRGPQVLVDGDLPITRGAVVAAWSIIYAFQNSPIS